MSMSLASQESLEKDYSDEFVATMSGNFPGLEEAYERELEEGGEERVQDLLNELGLDADDEKVEARNDDDGNDDDSVSEKQATSETPYDKSAREALEAAFKPAEEERMTRREAELQAELARERGYREALEARGRENKEERRLARPTGIPEVDEVLREQGLLDTSPQLPPEFASRLEQLEAQTRQARQQAQIEARGRQMAAEARQRAAQITAVFKDVPTDTLAELILSNGDGLRAAREFYKKAGCLGEDGYPTSHPSAPARKAMPQAGSEAAGRRAGAADRGKKADAYGWRPTDNYEERQKRLNAYGR